MRRLTLWTCGALAAAAICAALAQPSFSPLSLGNDLERAPNASAEVPSEPSRSVEGGTVLVLLLESRAQLEAVRAQLPPQRMLASSSRAFALAGGLIVTSDLSAAGEPIGALGWQRRSVQILSARAHEEPVATGTASTAAGRIADLARKDELTRAEAMLLLEHLEQPLPLPPR